jgi:predicted nucleotidyltransferase
MMREQISNDLTLITEAVTSVVEPVAIYLFGSYAYGTPNEDSDIDIYAVVPDSVEDTLELSSKIRLLLYKKKSNPMDLLISRRSAFDSKKRGHTLENIVDTQGIKIYG